MLTVDEIKALKVGDWIWIIVLKGDRINAEDKGRYYHINNASEFGEDELWCGWKGYCTAFEYKDYGDKWIAYKNKELSEINLEDNSLPANVRIKAFEMTCFFKERYIEQLVEENKELREVERVSR